MGSLTRQHDWAKTSLGPPENWPLSLKIALGILLQSRLPMCLFWGPERLCFYNDACRSALGKPENQLPPPGLPGVAVWTDHWPELQPLLDRVLAGNEPAGPTAPPLPGPGNGQQERIAQTYSFSPVRDEQGQVAGVLAVGPEPTRQAPNPPLLTLSQERFGRMIDKAPVAMALFMGPELVIALANERALEYWGRTRNEVIWKPVAETLPPADRQAIEPLLRKVYTTGNRFVVSEVAVLLTRNGLPTPAYVDFVYDPFYEDDGSISGVVVMGTEITGQVQTRRQIQTSQRQLHNLFAQAPVAISTFRGPEYLIELANETQLQLWGRTADEVLHKPVFEALPESRGQGFEQLLATVLETGETIQANESSVRLWRNGQLETVYFNFLYRPERAPDGTISGVISMANEITVQVNARKALEMNEAKLKGLVEAAPVAIGLFMGRDLVIELPNQAFIDIVGKGPGVVGKPLREAMPELITENQPFLQILDEVYTSGKTFQSFGSLVQIVQQGVMTHRYYNIAYTPLFNADGEVYGILDTAVDVTGQVLAQQELSQQKDFLQNALDLGDLGTFQVDLDTGMATYTDNIRQWFELPDLTAPIARVHEKVHPADQPVVAESIGQTTELTNQNRHDITYRLHGRDGRITHYLRSIGKVDQPEGQPPTLNGMIQNVTAQLQARQALEKSELRYRKLAEDLENRVQQRTQELELANQDLQRSNDNLQQFAYVASHDLQEPLRKIQSFSSLLEQRHKDQLGAEGLDYLERMTAAGARMSTLIKDLLAYSRIATRQQMFGEIDLASTLNDALTTLDWEIAQREAQVEVGTMAPVKGDRTQLSQLFQNLLSNAIKFTPPGQKPHIQVAGQFRQRSELPARVKPTNEATTFYEISVRDQGVGFDEKYLDRIFQVFQRLHSKKEFPGTGVGLAICQRVSENHGGAITATSQPGQGATFRVYLPA